MSEGKAKHPVFFMLDVDLFSLCDRLSPSKEPGLVCAELKEHSGAII